MVPMRAVSSYLNGIEDVAVESSSGKWWSGNLNNIYIGSNSIGDATLSLNFSDLLLGRLEFQVLISSEEINFKGNLGRSLFGETSVKDATFEIDVIKAYNKGKSIPQAISMLKGEINLSLIHI